MHIVLFLNICYCLFKKKNKNLKKTYVSSFIVLVACFLFYQKIILQQIYFFCFLVAGSSKAISSTSPSPLAFSLEETAGVLIS